MRQEMVGLWDAVASAGPYAKTACRKIGKKIAPGVPVHRTVPKSSQKCIVFILSSLQHIAAWILTISETTDMNQCF